MAITYTQVKGAAAVAALPPGTLVAEVDDHARERRFHPVNAPGVGTAASMVYPSVAAVRQLHDSEGNATGPVHLRLTPGIQDLVAGVSPLAYVLDQHVSVVTASGVFH